MKPLPKKLLPLMLFGIAVTSLFFVQPAQAYTVTMQQVGANVVANGSGPINLTGLTFSFPFVGTPGISASNGTILTGARAILDVYRGLTGLTGPANFGSGAGFADTGTGDMVGVSGPLLGSGPVEFVIVPTGYVSGNALTDSMTFDNESFASLGVTPGTYVWSWGDGVNQRFTLIIGAAGVPDGGATVSLLSFALLGLAAVRRKLSC